ncbi:MAG: aldo/keto reductase [Pseudomonadota bacterium]
MERRPLGRTGLDVPVLCLGTMMYGDQMGREAAFAQMDAAFERGIDFFDTAEMYTIPPKRETWGDSERIVGAWMKERGVREKIVLATKVVGRSRNFPWIRDEESLRLTPEQIKAACELNLQRLQTDYIDLYQLHWSDRLVPSFGGELRGYRHYKADYTPFEDILGALDDLVTAGKVRHVGLSNETPWGVMRYLHEAEKRGRPRVASVQNCYNLLNRLYEYGLAEVGMNEDVGLLAYSPMGQGVLSGKYLGGEKPKGSRGEMFGRLGRYETPGADDAIRAYVQIAQDFGLDPSAMAMQFVTTRPWVTTNMFGASNMEQLDLVFSSLEIEWTKELDDAVAAVHMRAPNVCM